MINDKNTAHLNWQHAVKLWLVRKHNFFGFAYVF